MWSPCRCWAASLLLAALPSAGRPCFRHDVAPDPLWGGGVWNMSGCTSLDLSCAPTPGVGRVPPCNNSLHEGELTEVAAALSTPGPHTTALTDLQFRGSWLGPTGVLSLAQALSGVEALETLGLGSCRLGDKGARLLASKLAESPPPRLRRLELSHNSIGDDGARAVAAALLSAPLNALPSASSPLPGLRELDLSWNAIGPRGGKHLAEALETNDALHKLVLDWNGLSDRGARAVAGSLGGNGALRELSLEYCAIKTDGAKALATGLRTNGALRRLSLAGNGVSAAAAKEVAEAVAAEAVAAAEPEAQGGSAGVAGGDASAGRAVADDDEVEEISFDDE